MTGVLRTNFEFHFPRNQAYLLSIIILLGFFQISNFELFSRILPRRIELRKNLNKNFEPEPLHRNTGYDLYENHTSTEYYCNLEGAIS